ncbi:hypothetical protein VTN96DRAFT_9146 [Rasamsonia emersonii]
MAEAMMDESQSQHQQKQQAQTQTQTQPPSTKRKAESSDHRDRSNVIHFTSRNPLWTYLKLQLITHPLSLSAATLDAVTARTYLTSALSQFLGLTGTAIPIDILKIEKARRGDVFMWIRVPREDVAAVVSALSSWIGGSTSTSTTSSTSSAGIGVGDGGNVAWRVCAKGNFLGALVHGSGSELFQP